jgi:hypothetical protein
MSESKKKYVCIFNKTGFDCKEIDDKDKEKYGIEKVYDSEEKCVTECKKQNEAFRKGIPESYEKLYTTDGWLGQFKHIYALVNSEACATIRYPFTNEFLKDMKEDENKKEYDKFLRQGELYKIADSLHAMAVVYPSKLDSSVTKLDNLYGLDDIYKCILHEIGFTNFTMLPTNIKFDNTHIPLFSYIEHCYYFNDSVTNKYWQYVYMVYDKIKEKDVQVRTKDDYEDLFDYCVRCLIAKDSKDSVDLIYNIISAAYNISIAKKSTVPLNMYKENIIVLTPKEADVLDEINKKLIETLKNPENPFFEKIKTDFKNSGDTKKEDWVKIVNSLTDNLEETYNNIVESEFSKYKELEEIMDTIKEYFKFDSKLYYECYNRDALSELAEEHKKIDDSKLIIMPILTGGHSSMCTIYKKKICYFESLPKSYSQTGEIITEMIKKKLSTHNEDIEIENYTDSKINIQRNDQYCTTWSMLMMLLYIVNPGVDYMSLLSAFNLTAIKYSAIHNLYYYLKLKCNIPKLKEEYIVKQDKHRDATLKFLKDHNENIWV